MNFNSMVKRLMEKYRTGSQEQIFEPKSEAEIMNAVEGYLGGYDCPLCHNKGTYYRMTDGIVTASVCECMTIRRTLKRLKETGLEKLIEKCTFENFQTNAAFQKRMLTLAKNWCADPTPCYFVGGQSGCGKTHICTAIVAHLIYNSQRTVRYMQWRQDSLILKALVNQPEYAEKIHPLKYADVLYIDDMFKTGTQYSPSQGDINLAFEIINFRYINRLPTIISSEYQLDEIIRIDEATGSRIKEMCARYITNIKRNSANNYRLN